MTHDKLNPIGLTELNRSARQSLGTAKTKSKRSFRKFNVSTKKLVKGCSMKKRDFKVVDRPRGVISISGSMISDSSISCDLNIKAPADQIEIVVLLINPVSRHFEVISCRLDMNESSVEDILDVVSKTVSEKLRDVNFTGVSNQSGEEFKPYTKINNFITGKELLIATFDSKTASECLKHARPILKNPEFISMLRVNGITEIQPVKRPRKSWKPSFQKVLPCHAKSLRKEQRAIVTKSVKLSKKVGGSSENMDGFLYVAVLMFVTSVYVSFF